jgi:hypothetical protein
VSLRSGDTRMASNCPERAYPTGRIGPAAVVVPEYPGYLSCCEGESVRDKARAA